MSWEASANDILKGENGVATTAAPFFMVIVKRYSFLLND